MKKITYAIIIVLCLSLIPMQTASASDWKYVKAAMDYQKAGRCDLAIPQYQKAISISKKASTYRGLAVCYEKLGQFQNAANTYYAEAELHKALGATQTYLATKQLADNLFSEVDVYFEVDKIQSKPLAKYEPASGAYFGAFIDQDTRYENTGGKYANKYSDFNNLISKIHATFFVYHKYGTPFPKETARLVKEAGGALQIALQPEQGLSQVNNDGYLKQFANDAKASEIPIFVRFASEMNGKWVKWHGNPTLYKEKFQLVAKVLRENAPNIAMVWSPNSMPADTIHSYYPGDAAVDWVGMNVYSNPFNNGQAHISTENVNPLTFLDTVYNKYPNKPMMIAEYGASHFSETTNGQRKDQTKFGQAKMRLFYEGIRLKYPRIKSVHWFSVDTLTSRYVAEDRRLNNFSLTANKTITNTYKEIISQDYFLSKVVNGAFVSNSTTGKGTVNINNATIRYSSPVKISSYVKTYDPYISKVVYELNGQNIGQSTAFPYDITISPSQLKASNKLKVVVYDSKNRVATTKTVTFNKSSAKLDLQPGQLQLFLNDKFAYKNVGMAELEVAPFTTNGRTLVPIRFISENLNGTVHYQASTKRITINKGSSKIVMTVGSKTGSINGKTITFEAAPILKNGTTFVPLRVVADALNAKISYDSKSHGISISQ
ncbi:stalk domain-containing protein [Lysinibacillus sp. 54212]|uniref:stalk domain-containing protein n=1 Tax=Lysinibacillus sp. 54212 TaxID=3119829 RepID=UPI002FCC27EA